MLGGILTSQHEERRHKECGLLLVSRTRLHQALNRPEQETPKFLLVSSVSRRTPWRWRGAPFRKPRFLEVFRLRHVNVPGIALFELHMASARLSISDLLPLALCCQKHNGGTGLGLEDRAGHLERSDTGGKARRPEFGGATLTTAIELKVRN